jgi:hypothetical protein
MKLKIFYAIFGALVLLFAPAVQAQQAATVKGKVKEQGGKALAGVSIRAVNAANQKDAHEARSDSKGEFEIQGLGGGEYVFTFTLAGFRTFVTRRLEVKAGDTINLRSAIEMSRESAPYALIRGVVFNNQGFSLPNATVTIERIGEGKRLKEERTSGEDGTFSIRLPAEKATYRITATARGFQPDSKEVEVDSDEVKSVALSLERVK